MSGWGMFLSYLVGDYVAADGMVPGQVQLSMVTVTFE